MKGLYNNRSAMCAAMQVVRHRECWNIYKSMVPNVCHARVRAMQTEACPETRTLWKIAHLVMPINVVIAVS